MASHVLFIVTIPCEAEETRLKQEFLARKLDNKSEYIIGNNTTNAPDSATQKATTQLKKVETAPTLLLPLAENNHQSNNEQIEGQVFSGNVEAISGTTADVQSCDPPGVDNIPNGAAIYGTFPKRRKSDKNKHVEVSEAVKKIGSGSLKHVDINLTDAPTPARRKSLDGIRDIMASMKRKQLKKKPQQEMELTETSPMEVVLREILRKFQIINAVWCACDEGSMYQIVFTVEFNEICEKLLDHLNEWGIGDRDGSTVSVMNCLSSKTFSQKEENDLDNDNNAENIADQKQGAWERFMNSVRSRLNVTQIVQNVRQDAAITFDFLVLLISAAILAAFGLAEDSTIFLASSMLISPLMGPIIATIFGTVIKDNSLGKLGLKNELYGLLGAILVGFIFGMIVCTTDDRYSVGAGLTDEMLSRCDLHSLIVGVFTAIPSGAAAAIGILGGNIGSLVGVAISASLLPPAVNSGLLWSLAVIYKFFEYDDTRYTSVVKTMRYSDNQATELAILGSISMCLTISNIICIYFMGILVLKIKEIAPLIASNNREFWQHDIKIARGLNHNVKDGDNAIIDEFANLAKEDQKALGLNYDLLRTISTDEATYQNTWSPMGRRHPLETSYEPLRGNYSTIHPLDKLYTTITHQVSMREKRPRFSMPRRATGRLAESVTSYKLLTENIPRCSTMPSNGASPTVTIVSPNTTNTAYSTAYNSKCNSEASTPTGITERKRRKFIVTPAENDPLQPLCGPDDLDVYPTSSYSKSP